MKNKKRLLIIIPLVIMICGMMLIAAGLFMGAVDDYKAQLQFRDFEVNVPSNNIYDLDIDVGLADINIISTNDIKDFNIKAHNVTKNLITYTTTNNTLRLRYEIKKWYNAIFLPAYWSEESSIDLYIPAGLKLKDVEIESSCGIKVNYLTANRVFITSGRGDCEIDGLQCNYADITDNGGSLSGKNIKAAGADLNLDAKSAVFENFVSESVIMNNDGTNVELSGIIDGDSTFYSSGGDVNITMYSKELSDYSFNVVGGDVSVNGSKPPENEDASYRIKVKGDININVK